MLAKQSGLVQRLTHRGGWRLAVWLLALVAVWSYTIATSTVGGNGRLELHPVGQLLQYLLVVLASTLAGNHLIVAARGRDADDAVFGFYDYRWSVRHDMGGRVWWTCIWAGIAAMVVNILILGAAELLPGRVEPISLIGEYVGLVGLGIAAGAVIGSFSALIASVVSR